VHGKGFSYGVNVTVSYHHNIITQAQDRVPVTTDQGDMDWVNNLVYNAQNPGQFNPMRGCVRINAVGNYYQRGPMADNGYRAFYGQGWRPGNETANWACSGMYLSGNIDTLHRPNNSLPETDYVTFVAGPPSFPVVGTRWNFPLLDSTTDAFTGRAQVLAQSGMRKPAQDAVDVRVLNDIANGTGNWVIDDPSEVGGYPNLPVIQRPAGYDTDGDGIPDSWELAHGLNPKNPTDGTRKAGDGYTNLEKYLNDTATAAK
jgi:Bacterial TSP3 repeat